MLNIFTVTALCGLAVILERVSSYTETCVGESCFAMPGSGELKNFDDANSWCAVHNSTLAVVRESETQITLAQFLSRWNVNVMMFINLKHDQYKNISSWFLVNGSRYSGAVGNQQYNAYRLYCNLQPGNQEFYIEAAYPSSLRNYVCDFEGARCQSNSKVNLLFNNRCYVKYDNENLTWYKARERCINYGGELAQFQSAFFRNPWIPPFNTSWLNQSLTYWIGIRWSGWSWKSSDGNEMIYSSWSDGKPNNVNFSCACVDPNGIPAWSWTDCDCSVQRSFVCLKIVPTTTVTANTSPSTTFPAIPTTATTLNTMPALSNKSEGIMIVGLVLGLAVILPLAIFSVVLIVWIVHLRRRLRENDRNDESATTTVTAKTPQANAERNAARINAPDPDINYQHLKRETMFGPGTSMPLYDQLNHRDNQGYEVPSETT